VKGTSYSAANMSQIRDKKRFTTSEMAASVINGVRKRHKVQPTLLRFVVDLSYSWLYSMSTTNRSKWSLGTTEED